MKHTTTIAEVVMSGAMLNGISTIKELHEKSGIPHTTLMKRFSREYSKTWTVEELRAADRAADGRINKDELIKAILGR